MPKLIIYKPEAEGRPRNPRIARAFNGLRFKTGSTEITDPEYISIASNTEFQKAIAQGSIVVKEAGETIETLAAANLGSMTATEAVEIVDQTFEVSTLEAYLTGENRKTVRNAIAARIKAIEEGEAA
jgi:hypothetical protein